MNITKLNDEVICSSNQLEFKLNKIGFDVISDLEEIFMFNISTSVNNDKDIEDVKFTFDEKTLTAIWITKSDLWNEKKYTLKLYDNCALYTVTVTGNGSIQEVKYLRDSDYNTCGYYLPAVHKDAAVNQYFRMNEDCDNDLVCLTPAPLCYVFDMEGNKAVTGVGLVAKDGCYNFDTYSYRYENARCSFHTNFYGYTTVSGEYELPSILINIADDEESVLKGYADFHYENGYCQRTFQKKEKWWYGPFFCGWGDQWIKMVKSQKENGQVIDWGGEVAAGNTVENGIKPMYGSAVDAATEKEYREMIAAYTQKNIPVSMIIIDDKWQKEYGTLTADTDKWPDLRAFIDEMHANNTKVMLWIKLWNPEGLNDNECIRRNGINVGVDPTSPYYQKRMSEMMYRLLSSDAGCYNADGFKLDFGNCVPIGDNLEAYEKGVYGIEMIKRLISLIYKEAKKIKQDALISNSCAHPYFCEVTDMFRLHDYCSVSNNGISNMKNRTMFAKTAFGDDMLIDTDGTGGAKRRDSMLAFRQSVKYGIPDLYGVELFSCLTDEDWKEVSKIYNDYYKKIQ